jgi:hypothetical protein
VEHAIARWTAEADGDIERRCRSLRSVAIRQAVTVDDLDPAAVVKRLLAS